jgi:3-phosphoshikimate 1-carboxyvinyltransferase
MAAVTTLARVDVPGDKSISHRALLFAALATGESRVSGILESADVQSTAGALRALGVVVPPLAAHISLTGVGLRGLRPAAGPLDCGNSGTSTRLLAGIVAACPFETTFVGDASLSARPMRRVAAPLEAMGAVVTLAAGGTLPMRIRGGALRPVRWVSEVASAQVKSAVLLAGLVAGVEVSVAEPAPSRDHTERFLRALGADLRDDHGVTLRPTTALRAFSLAVPRDPSSAAFFAALAALGGSPGVELPGVLASRTRDGFFRALLAMGAAVESDAPVATASGEFVTTWRIEGVAGGLRGLTVGGDGVAAMIDELPLLACVGAHAAGETRITGAEELRVKESDRIAVTVANLRAVGARAGELPDGLWVDGHDGPLRGRVVTHGDHRIAMAFAILGARPGNAIEIDDPACVAVSYPGFWSTLARVRA